MVGFKYYMLEEISIFYKYDIIIRLVLSIIKILDRWRYQWKNRKYYLVQDFSKYFEDISLTCEEINNEKFTESYKDILSLFYKRNELNDSYKQVFYNDIVPIHYKIKKTAEYKYETYAKIDEDIEYFKQRFNYYKEKEKNESNYYSLYNAICDSISDKAGRSMEEFSQNLIKALGITLLKEDKINSFYFWTLFLDQAKFIYKNFEIEKDGFSMVDIMNSYYFEVDKAEKYLSLMEKVKTFDDYDLQILNELKDLTKTKMPLFK